MKRKKRVEEIAENTEQAEKTERVETPYDNIIETLYPYREPLERIVYVIKRAAVLAGIVVLGMCTMTVGDTAQPDYGQQVAVGLPVMDAHFTEEWFGEGIQGPSGKKKSGERTLNISVVDELPQESELEIFIIGKDNSTYDSYGHGNDSVFSHTTTLIDREQGAVRLLQEDGSIKEDEGMKIEMNTVYFFVPDGSIHSLDTPNFSAEILGEGEWEKRRQMAENNVEGEDCEEFNAGIDHARQLIKEGYLDDKITEFLLGFPEIAPFEREYTLELTYAGETYREEDETGWWEVDYSLYTTAGNGEVIMPLTLRITYVTMACGMMQVWDDAHYSLWADGAQLWQLMEDPVKDKGRVRLQQVIGDSFADEESVRRFVEEQGAAFFLPEGADAEVEWNCRKQEEFYYDYLVWEGGTADYDVTLAVPLMEKKDEGYYLASYIRKEAEDKAACRHVLSDMLQTLRGRDYLHVVKEGESLCQIAEKYLGSQDRYIWIWLYNEADDTKEDFANPDLIYPGQKVYVKIRGGFEYDAYS